MAPMDYGTQLDLFKRTWNNYNRKEQTVPTAPVVLDLEKVDYIHNPTKITQVGLRILSNAPKSDNHLFFLITENRRYRNRFCTAVDHTNFAFGKNGSISRQRDIRAAMIRVVDSLQREHEKVIIIGWDVGSDMGWLKSGAGWTPPAGESFHILDLQAVYMAIHNIHKGSKPRLSKALADSGIKFLNEHLHNAGNDAHYTGEMFLDLGKLIDDRNSNVQSSITSVPNGAVNSDAWASCSANEDDNAHMDGASSTWSTWYAIAARNGSLDSKSMAWFTIDWSN